MRFGTKKKSVLLLEHVPLRSQTPPPRMSAKQKQSAWSERGTYWGRIIGEYTWEVAGWGGCTHTQITCHCSQHKMSVPQTRWGYS